MKTTKSLENFLYKNGWTLYWNKYGVFNCIPYAKKNNINIALCFDINNKDTNSYNVVDVLDKNISKKELASILQNMEKLINDDFSMNYSSIGTFVIQNWKSKKYYTFS